MTGRVSHLPRHVVCERYEKTMKSARGLQLSMLVLLAVAMGIAGCDSRQPSSVSDSVQPGNAPVPADLTRPESAVASYLDWTAYAYRLGESDVATRTMSPQEEVRVNAYVQLNHEQGRRIAQVLTTFRPRVASIVGTRAAVGVYEVWKYRYLSADGMRAISSTYTAAYETTYTVIQLQPNTWVVDSVEVRPLGDVE